MDTLSIRLLYRPVRIGWCVATDDMEAVRRAVRLSFAIWGGTYNPIIPVEDEELSTLLIDVFRVDALFAATDTKAVKDFVAARKHLPWPGHYGLVLLRGNPPHKALAMVDVEHPIRRIYEEHLKNNPNPQPALDVWEWDANDPLKDILLCTYGGMPTTEEVGKDYVNIAAVPLMAQRKIIPINGHLPVWEPGRETVATLNRTYIEQHYAVRNYRDHPGFFVGDAANFSDLVTYWNLRAADIELLFYDPRYADRCEELKEYWAAAIRRAPKRPGRGTGVALWHRRESPLIDTAEFGEGLTISRVDKWSWNGLNIKPPIMQFGLEAVLASLTKGPSDKPGISFALNEPPFIQDRENFNQSYVLSVDPGIGLFGDERYTLHTPFIPELNEYYGRHCYHEYNAARAEPESLGIITSISTQHVSLRALDVTQLITAIFKSVGIKAELSSAGRICATLIRQMGGLDGCRPFKIAGVRRLIEDYRSDESLSRSAAMQTIRGQGDTRPISEYQWLYIEQRKVGSPLTNDAVLGYLLDRGVFRAGLKFVCPNCELEFWRSFDDAKVRLECDYCGNAFNSSRQLRDKDWAFRRSGLFGRDDHQEGAIPVTLALQQLMHVIQMSEGIYTPALSLRPEGAAIHNCETDFVVVSSKSIDGKIQIVIGECKTRKPVTVDDVEKLKAVADAFPSERYDVYVLFARLTAFTPEEIGLIRPLNLEWRRRVILMTERELEPYFVYERTKLEFQIDDIAVNFEAMARVTHDVYFEPKPR